MEEETWGLALEKAGYESVEGGFVVGVTIVFEWSVLKIWLGEEDPKAGVQNSTL